MLDDDLIVRIWMPPDDTRANAQEDIGEAPPSSPGVVRAKQRASLSLFWSGINNGIRAASIECQDHLPSNTNIQVVTTQKTGSFGISRIWLIEWSTAHVFH